MKTQILRTEESIIVKLDGRLDFGTADELRASLEKLLRPTKMTTSTDLPRRKEVIFDLKGLDFVGSSGIANFVNLLRDFNRQCTTRPKYCNVKSEFQKIMRALDEDNGFDFISENTFPSAIQSRRAPLDH